MSVATVPSACCCGSIGRSDLRQCPIHFHLWDGDIRLTSVTRVIHTIINPPCKRCRWPMNSAHMPGCPQKANMENAAARGKEVDRLFCAYLNGELRSIPAGVREDSRDLLEKLANWYCRQNYNTVETQVVIGNGRYGGVVDFIFDRSVVADLKCVATIQPTHEIQVAGYYDILYSKRQKPEAIALLQANRNGVDWIPVKPSDLCIEWAVLSDAYQLLERRNQLTPVEVEEF